MMDIAAKPAPGNHASALLTRLVLQALLAERSITLPTGFGALPDALRQGQVDAGLKRRLLDHALAQAGPAALIRAGRGICRQGFAPPLLVLLRAADPAALAAQWMRLERYFHARNRTRLVLAAPASLAAERWCVPGGGQASQPARSENLLIQGLLWGLLERFGCRDVQVEPGSDDTRWQYHWRGLARPAETALAQLDPLPLDPLALDPLPLGPRAQKLARHLARDPAHGWRLQDAAGALRQSPRSLQRALAADGTSFQGLLRGLRIRAACGLLLGQDWSLAEIGYACGFADQAHFQRQFRAATNFTPGDYRALGRA